MNILGLSCFQHDSAACLVRDGVVIAAVEEERLTRIKHDNAFPVKAIQSVLNISGMSGNQLDAVVFYENPQVKLARLSEMAKIYADKSQTNFEARTQFYESAASQLPSLIQDACGYSGELSYCDHHLSHAASCFYQSPFDEAAILVIDGAGEWATTSLYHGRGTEIASVSTVRYPHSLGLLCATITSFLGFEANEGEYKVMGLAAYGKPTVFGDLSALISFDEDGGFALDLTYFEFMHNDERLFSEKLVNLLGQPRKLNEPVLQHHMDLAASLQKLIERAILHLVADARLRTGSKNLCLSGDVAHNIVANTKVRMSDLFDNTFIHFASSNNGGAIGAALYVYYQRCKAPRFISRPSPYLGPDFSDEEILSAITDHGFQYEELVKETLLSRVAKLLHDGFVIGWLQGRMEFGPRALGNRSILASACSPHMKNILNTRVKHREEFRPFAPAILADKSRNYFDITDESPAMLYAANVKLNQQASVPSITHVDGTARPQTIKREDNALFYDLIAKFEELSGVPLIINTSFNVRGEPIVCSPKDAINCFIGTDIDILVMGRYLIRK